MDGVLERVGHVVHLGPFGLAIEVLEEEQHVAFFRVSDGPLQTIDRGLLAQPHIGGEVVAAVHDDPFRPEACGKIDVGLQIPIDRIAQEGRNFRDIHR